MFSIVSGLVLVAGWLAVLASRPAEPEDPVAQGRLPQYVLFNQLPHISNYSASRPPEPLEVIVKRLQEIPAKLGGLGHDRLRVGSSFLYSVLEGETPALVRALETALAAVEQTKVPVLLVLDAQNWWTSRSDLWNWWDANLPGYDPQNRMNVEWSGWGPEHALKIAWRNWGHQLRIQPPPNIFSPRVVQEVRDRLAACVPVIVRWYRQLPDDQKYLLAGVRVGWETSINVNAYYFADGNAIFEKYPNDESHDPKTHDMQQGWTFGRPILGYAAATSSGLKKEGTLTRQDHETLVHRYLADHCAQVRALGVPASLLFTHQGGTYEPWDRHLSFKPAMVEDSIPGWSFYSHGPADCGPMGREMEEAGRQQWGAVEWWRGGATEAEWYRNFVETLNFKHCRLIVVYNWEPFCASPSGVAAVRRLIADSAQRQQPYWPPNRPSSEPQ